MAELPKECPLVSSALLFINLIQGKGDVTMKGRLIITVILGLIILSCFSSPTFAGVDATPWHTQLNKLNSVMNVVDSINRRLARLADVLPPDPAKLRMPAPEGVIGM